MFFHSHICHLTLVREGQTEKLILVSAIKPDISSVTFILNVCGNSELTLFEEVFGNKLLRQRSYLICYQDKCELFNTRHCSTEGNTCLIVWSSNVVIICIWLDTVNEASVSHGLMSIFTERTFQFVHPWHVLPSYFLQKEMFVGDCI